MDQDPRKALEDALNEPLEERLRRAVAGLEDGVDLEDDQNRLLEIGGRVDSIAAEHRAKLGDDAEFEARVAALHAKVDRVAATRAAIKTQTARQQASDGKATAGMGIGLSIAYTIIGCPITGYVIGYLLDNRAGTTSMRTNGAFIGIVIGMGVAVFLIQRSSKQL
jgi:F0F1-type ATP synthase assembly protein I